MIRNRLRENLDAVRQTMADAACRSGRTPEAVALVAVTKTQPPERVRPLIELGAIDLGENYPQELWAKVEALGDRAVHWHLIGHLQGNKAKRTLPLVRVLHGIDSLKLLRRLDDLAAGLDSPPAVLLQVNTSGEDAKHGWQPEGLLADAEAIAACRHIPIRGLMTMAALGTTAEQARPSFARLRDLRDALRRRTSLPLDDLSMGMSNDYAAAIEEGATIVRVGSALFEGIGP